MGYIEISEAKNHVQICRNLLKNRSSDETRSLLSQLLDVGLMLQGQPSPVPGSGSCGSPWPWSMWNHGLIAELCACAPLFHFACTICAQYSELPDIIDWLALFLWEAVCKQLMVNPFSACERLWFCEYPTYQGCLTASASRRHSLSDPEILF